eukprot:270528-Chlamydomonas_euryale.AAC.5
MHQSGLQVSSDDDWAGASPRGSRFLCCCNDCVKRQRVGGSVGVLYTCAVLMPPQKKFGRCRAAEDLLSSRCSLIGCA